MNLLAIDASTEACSVALEFKGKTYTRYEFSPQSHSILLLPMVDEVLAEAGVTLNQLDGLVYGRGPGSFTGVRIGIGVAQGLAYSANLPVVGVSTLQAMAQQALELHGHASVVSAIDARMAEIYCGVFMADANKVMQPFKAEAVIAPTNLDQYLAADITDLSLLHGVGSAWKAYSTELAKVSKIDVLEDIEFPVAKAMLKIAKAEFDQGKAVSAEKAEPVYLRDTVTWKKLPGR
ncbi:tRNA (adenosine(37)-N6)-threonylcarbamoyltransferase complex dimerization subunit type 1 TsaB [Thalassotalea aquiviva]|uniref:tRNA (adenosine(37)-N6)-threonylcarbamoyltransferase complex dimerization subunit type 1 TsaB n=1 Tax=Thalassotalea aquiviva TaxID=3242415 RepID=UPI00352A35EC